MLSYLQFYEAIFGPLRLFQFISVRAILAGITALVIGYILGPKMIRFLQNFGARQAFRDKDEVGDLADLHKAKAKTPTMGGLLIFISVFVSSVLWAEMNVYVLAALVAYILLTLVGFLDDFFKVSKRDSKGLAGRYKLLGQLVTTGIVLFILLGPLTNILTGFDGNATGSALKMKELWVPLQGCPPCRDANLCGLCSIFSYFNRFK